MNQEELQNILEGFHKTIKEQQDKIAELHATIQVLHQNVQANTVAAAVATQVATAPVAPNTATTDCKVAAPITFHGNRKTARTFLLQLKNNFQAQPNRFSTDSNKIAFAISYLRDAAFDWIAPLIEQGKHIDLTFVEFEEQFNANWCDIDAQKKAEDAIFNIKQRNRPVNAMVADFQRLAYESKISDSALFPLFYRALNDDIKDELSKIERPALIDEYFKLAISIDNRLYERKREKSSFRPSKSMSTTSNAPPNSRQPNDMIIDNVQRREPLTVQEKQRRKDNNLCLYCGSNSHLLPECTVKPGKGKARV